MPKPDVPFFGHPPRTVIKVLRMILKGKDIDSFFDSTAA